MRSDREPLPPDTDPVPRLARLAPALLAGVGVISSAVLLWSLREGEGAQARSAFELEAMERIAAVRRELDSSLEQLHSTVALFVSSEIVYPEEFRTFTARGLKRHTTLRAIAYIENGGAAAFPVRYREGPESRPVAVGTDLGLDPVALAALARCRDERALVFSAPLASITAEGGQRVLAALPFIALDERLRGFVGGLLDVEELLARADRGQGFGMSLADVGGAEPAMLAGPSPDEGLSSTEELALGGRTWRITCTAPPGFVARHTTWRPWVVFALGLVATAFLVSTVATATSRARIQQLVRRRTGEIQAAYDSLAHQAMERVQAMTEARQLEQRLREIVDLVPDMIYVKDWHGRFLLANVATAEAYGTTVEALTASADVEMNTDVTEPDETLREERLLMEAELSSVVPAMPFVDADGQRRILRLVKIPCSVFGKDTRAVLCVATDITERVHAEHILRSQSRILGELAQGVDPRQVLADLVGAAEEIVPGMRCSVLLLSSDGRHLCHGSAPSLPRDYNDAIDGLEIGPTAGSCGAAAHSGERIIVEDVMTHPNWEPYRDLAESTDIRACWSQPIRTAEGEVLGTFAMYYSEPRAPEPYEEELIESMAHLAGIAIERGRLQSPS